MHSAVFIFSNKKNWCPKDVHSLYVSIHLLHCLGYYSLVVSFEIRKWEYQTIFFFFKILLTILVPSAFNINYRISLWFSAKKKATGILIGIYHPFLITQHSYSYKSYNLKTKLWICYQWIKLQSARSFVDNLISTQ